LGIFERFFGDFLRLDSELITYGETNGIPDPGAYPGVFLRGFYISKLENEY